MKAPRFELNTTYTAQFSDRDYLVRAGDVLKVVDIDHSDPNLIYGILNGQWYFRLSEANLVALLYEDPNNTEV